MGFRGGAEIPQQPPDMGSPCQTWAHLAQASLVITAEDSIPPEIGGFVQNVYLGALV